MKTLNKHLVSIVVSTIVFACSGTDQFIGNTKTKDESAGTVTKAGSDNKGTVAQGSASQPKVNGEMLKTDLGEEVEKWKAQSMPELSKFPKDPNAPAKPPFLNPNCDALVVPETLTVRTFHEVLSQKLICLKVMVDQNLDKQIEEQLDIIRKNVNLSPEQKHLQAKAVLEKFKSQIESEEKRIRETRSQNEEFFKDLALVNEKVLGTCLLAPKQPPAPGSVVTDQQKSESQAAVEKKEAGQECQDSLKAAREFLVKN